MSNLGQIQGIVAEILPDTVQKLPDGFHRPGVLVAAGVVTAAGLGFDAWASFKDRRATGDELPLADPEVGAIIDSGLNQERRRNRVGAFLATGLLATGLVQLLAEPYQTESQTKGSATIVIDGSYAGDAVDIRSDDGMISRLQASIDAIVSASQDTDVPFSVVISGAKPVAIEHSDGGKLDEKDFRAKVNKKLGSATMRNGHALGDAINDTATETQNIIVIAPNLSDANDKAKVAATTQELAASKDGKISAIALGSGNTSYEVGFDRLESLTDPKSWEEVIGQDNVKTAKSTNEIVNEIVDLAESEGTTHKEATNHIPLVGSIIAAGGLAGLAFKRRFERLFNISKRIK